MADEKPRRKSGVWSVAKEITEEHTGLTIVISERTRGRPGFSYQLVHKEREGSDKHIRHPLRGLDKVPYDGDTAPKIEDVVKALFKAAREWVEEQERKNPKPSSSKPGKGKGKGKGKGRRGDRKPAGWLSALGRQDAEAKGGDKPYVGPTERKKQKRQASK